MSNRTLVIGDIHGCHTALRSLLKLVALDRSDTVVCLGDVVDRGPDSFDAIEQLLHVRDYCNFVGVLGNHDETFLDSVANNSPTDDWLSSGGSATLLSYWGSFEKVPSKHIAFLRRFVPAWENSTHIFVHANIEPTKPLAQQSPRTLRYTRLTGNETAHFSGKRVVCGHTGIPMGVPVLLPGIVAIDTWAYGGKWLTCLDTEHDFIYQASQSGQVRGPLPLAEIAVDFTDMGP